MQLFLLYYGGPFIGLSLDAVPGGLARRSRSTARPISARFSAPGSRRCRAAMSRRRECVGLSRAQIIRRILVPEMTMLVLPASVNMTIILMKETAIAVGHHRARADADDQRHRHRVLRLRRMSFLLALFYWGLTEICARFGRIAEARLSALPVRYGMSESAIVVRGLGKRFGQTEVLHGIDLEIAQGEVDLRDRPVRLRQEHAAALRRVPRGSRTPGQSRSIGEPLGFARGRSGPAHASAAAARSARCERRSAWCFSSSTSGRI